MGVSDPDKYSNDSRDPSGTQLCTPRCVELRNGGSRQVWFYQSIDWCVAVMVLPGRRYPDLISDDDKLLENSFVLPDVVLADVSGAPRASSEPSRSAAVTVGNASMPARGVREDLR